MYRKVSKLQDEGPFPAVIIPHGCAGVREHLAILGGALR